STAHALLVVGAALIDALGAHRRRGGGQVTVRCPALPDVNVALDWIAQHAAELPSPPQPRERPRPAIQPPAGTTRWIDVPLRLRLHSAVLAFAGSRGNLMTGTPFIRGTTLLGWAHRRLLHAFPTVAGLPDAVVTGQLLLLDAFPDVHGQRGLPAPLSLVQDKDR